MILEIINERNGGHEMHCIPEISSRVISVYVLYSCLYHEAYVDVLFDDGHIETHKASSTPPFTRGTSIIKAGFIRLPQLRRPTDIIVIPQCDDYVF